LTDCSHARRMSSGRHTGYAGAALARAAGIDQRRQHKGWRDRREAAPNRCEPGLDLASCFVRGRCAGSSFAPTVGSPFDSYNESMTALNPQIEVCNHPHVRSRWRDNLG
jgi:hypothetical protein